MVIELKVQVKDIETNECLETSYPVDHQNCNYEPFMFQGGRVLKPNQFSSGSAGLMTVNSTGRKELLGVHVRIDEDDEKVKIDLIKGVEKDSGRTSFNRIKPEEYHELHHRPFNKIQVEVYKSEN